MECEAHLTLRELSSRQPGGRRFDAVHDGVANGLDAKQVYSLLFKPGFSTVDHATKDAGRGVGMNLVADLMHQIGGRVGVATARGRFTRLTVTMPPQPKRADDTAAA